MYEKKVFRGFVVFVFVVLCIFTGLQTYRLESLRSKYNTTRVQLEEVTRQQQQLTDTVTKCRELTRETNEILSESFTGLQQLRSQLSIVRENYEAMEVLLCQYNGSNGSNDTVDQSN